MNKSILLFLIIAISCTTMGQKSYEKEWKEVEAAVRKGLPQSALKIVDSVYLDARSSDNAPQFLKATLYQIKLRSDFQENFMESSILQVETELKTASVPVKQILHSIRAELYWRYYQGNRYRFMERTGVSNPDLTDIKTWDLKTLVNTVTESYLASVGQEYATLKIKLDFIDPILETEPGSKIYRPMLYDFLAHRALEYFANEEPAVVRPAEGFLLDQENYFSPAGEFSSLKITSPDENDLKWRALLIYQNLLRFHSGDDDPSALIDADLARLKFVQQHSVLQDKDLLYKNALAELQEKHKSAPGAADVAYELAASYNLSGTFYVRNQGEVNRWDLKKAREICEKTIRDYPGTDGAKNCAILLAEISEPSLNFSVNYANVPDQPFLGSLNFRNVSTVYFRIVKADPEEDRNRRQREMGENLVAKYLALQPVKAWSVKLPDDGDFQTHNTQVRIPSLPKGYYVILASDNEGFSYENRPVAYSPAWVTGISYVSQRNPEDGKLEIYVLDRDKGIPMKGVSVAAYIREYDYKTRSYLDKLINTLTSDENGYISMAAVRNDSKSFFLKFSQGNDLYFTENYFYLYPTGPTEDTRITTYFFTDRSIYRPGQTVYFKGIVLERTGTKSEIKPGYSHVVTFYDVNNQKVSEKAVTTSDFGSFNGIFTAPAGGLTGEMSIRCETGSVGFSVEEYKRPRFKVEVDPLEGSYKLNETVNVTGKALNYSGSAVDQASVSYRVVRTARFPVWRSWWRWFPPTPETEITSGKTLTGADGSFSLSFKALPDLTVDRKYQPVFNYTVYVDVTDITGEVRSAEGSLSVGYQAMLLDAGIPDEVDQLGPDAFPLSATNLNRQPVPAEVKVSVHLLDAPARLIRKQQWENPDVFTMTREEFLASFPYELYDDENDPETWNKKELMMEKSYRTPSDSTIIINNLKSWKEGHYVLTIESKDAYGEKVETKKFFTLFNPSLKSLPSNDSFWYSVIKPGGEPGDTVAFTAGTAEQGVRLLYEIENDGKIISREWISLSREKRTFRIPVKEEYRGNFFVNLVFVKGNRSYGVSEQFTVPFTDKQLKITAETFRDKLTPGQEEEWKLRITGMNGDKVAAELLASMYDASLDAFRGHSWSFGLYPVRSSAAGWSVFDAFTQASSHLVKKQPADPPSYIFHSYDRLNWFGFNYYGGIYPRMGGMEMRMKNAMPAMDGMAADKAQEEAEMTVTESGNIPAEPLPDEKKPEVPDMPVRKNFNETAFFFPDLKTDEKGDVILSFTVPESLTAWKLMALAYTKDLKTGYLEKEVATRKELMVMTNAPRFFREGDQVMFAAKLVSMSDKKLAGKIQAEFFDAYTMIPVDALVKNLVKVVDFSVEKGKSEVFFWDIVIPEGLDALVCRVKASADEFSDGEEIVVPVLPNRMLVTETLPLPVNGKGTKNFKFSKLASSGKSGSLSSYRLTLEFTSNPAWYAVQALPYMTGYVHESADGLFTRYYANSLASYIANSNPKIKAVFESWKNITPDALLSNLEKNQELKAVLLNETPWVMEAKSESERKKRIAVLFDLNRMAAEQQSALAKLQQMQTPNGGWAWFKGMRDDRYVTQLIVTGIGRLQHLGVIELQRNPDLISMTQSAFRYLCDRLKEDYDDIKKDSKGRMDENHLGSAQIQYLYAYSYLMEFVKVHPSNKEAFDYFTSQAGKYWKDQNKYLQGMMAIALSRMNVPDVPAAILASLKENALVSEEMGMYWKVPEGYFWYEAPVERQAMLIEAFAEVTRDEEAVELMKIWLLKQKQTQDWKTSRATADAVYALLLKGTDLLASDQLVEVTLGTEKIDPLTMDGVTVQAGTGYFQVSKMGKEITPEMGNIKVVKKDEGIAWGAVYWQYFEHLDKITPAASPLSIERELYLERNTSTGPVLDPVFDNSILKTGDRVKARIIIRVDRDMEYVHMKDMRAAAFEPIEAISGYRWQDGLGYYESIRDASVNFYFDYLRKGTYVFEYPLNVTQKGEFSNGITSIQCLYAPEFAAHSQGIRVKVE
ncbi:MAG TPA: alpha-2-macroglobulin family protein [Bacteroidales bacterium]|nr:alpha-2-macroglobulin family protein [Bacteroidales bacterium]